MKWIAVPVLVSLSACAASQEVSSEEQRPGVPEVDGRPLPIATEAPETMTDEDGRVWLRMRPIEHRPAPAVPEPPAERPERPSLDSLSEEELAEVLRPVRAFMGHEYVLSIEDALDMVRSMRSDEGAAGNPPFVPAELELAELSEAFVGAEGREGRSVFGSDGRQQVSAADRNLYPYTTIAALLPGACTATRIGLNTLVTAAHCVYDGNVFWDGQGGFYPLPALSFAADNSGNLGRTTPFNEIPGDSDISAGNTDFTACYSVTVPWGWHFFADSALDVAVFRLSPVNGNGAPCPAVGNTGWIGVRPNVDPNGGMYWIAGYPAPNGDDAPPVINCYQDCTWTEPELGQPCPTVCDPAPLWGYPTLFASGNRTVSDNNIFLPNHVTHEIDTSGGQSGSAIMGLFGDPGTRHADPNAFPYAGGQGMFLIAVHSGYYDQVFDSFNRGVHIDYSWLSWLETSGGLTTTTHNPCTCEPGLWGPICYCFF